MRSSRESLLAETDWLAAHLGDPAVRIVDIRGSIKPPKVWRSEEDLRAVFQEAGVTPDRDVITYCNAGVSASVGLLGAKLLGYPHARNFAGSWYEWEHDPGNPIATG